VASGWATWAWPVGWGFLPFIYLFILKTVFYFIFLIGFKRFRNSFGTIKLLQKNMDLLLG
jgi:hypothetical protein